MVSSGLTSDSGSFLGYSIPRLLVEEIDIVKEA